MCLLFSQYVMIWVGVYHPSSCATCESMQLFDYVDELQSKYPTATVMDDFNVSELVFWSACVTPRIKCSARSALDQHIR